LSIAEQGGKNHVTRLEFDYKEVTNHNLMALAFKPNFANLFSVASQTSTYCDQWGIHGACHVLLGGLEEELLGL